jgi:hypothetical protein
VDHLIDENSTRDKARRPAFTADAEPFQAGRQMLGDLSGWDTPEPLAFTSATSAANIPTTPHTSAAGESGQAVLPGHHFLDCAGRGLLGEVWKVRAPDGRPALARLIVNPVFGDRPEQEVLRNLEEAGHPGVASWRVAARTPQRLTLLAHVAGRTLQDRYQACRGARELGLPRSELLSCLRQVADAVDEWSALSKLHHLALSPRSIFWNAEEATVVDAGFAELLGLPAGHNLFQLNPRYAAPELADNRFSAASDVYSLAVLYYELITGQMPHRGQGARQLLRARLEGVPGLDLLPGLDRFAIARALEPHPRRRFASCKDFVSELEETSSSRRGSRAMRELPSIISLSGNVSTSTANPLLPTPERFVSDLVATAARLLETTSLSGTRCRVEPGEALLYKGGARVFPEAAQVKLKEFCRLWQGRLRRVDGDVFELEVEAPTNWWQKLRGQKGGLRVRIELLRPTVKKAQFTEVAIRMQPIGCSAERSEVLLGPLRRALLEGLCELLEAGADQRRHERLLYPHPLRVIPVLTDRSEGKIIQCRGKDVSLGGMGLISPQPLPTPQVYIQPTFPSDHVPTAVLAKVVRVQQRTDGSFETGLLFPS